MTSFGVEILLIDHQRTIYDLLCDGSLLIGDQRRILVIVYQS